MDIALVIAGIAVSAWLLMILYRRDVRNQLRWFACYVSWEVLQASIQLVLLGTNFRLYVKAYWWMEALEIALTVAAVRESFLRIFRGFTRKSGFRWSVWCVIAAVAAYSAWKAIYAPPLQVNRLSTFVFGAEFLFRWSFLGIAVLTAVLSFLLAEPLTREDAVVTGFGASGTAFLLYLWSFSLFGTRYLFFTKYIPSMGYFVAVFWWIYVFSRPLRQFGFEELGIGPEEMRRVLRGYRKFDERL